MGEQRQTEIEKNKKTNTERCISYKIWKKRVGILSIFLGICIGVLFLSAYLEQQAAVQIEEQAGETQELTRFYVSHGQKEEYVNWWYNQNDGIYYLFLPSSMNQKKLQIGWEGTKKLQIDGENVKQGDTIRLAKGMHEIICYGNLYQLQVLQAEDTASFFLTTDSGAMDYLKEDKSNYESGKAAIRTAAGKIEYEGIIEKVHGRGNSTWYDGSKLPYTVKLAKKTTLFDMEKSRTWVLLANESDGTMLRNYAVHDMARNAGMNFTAHSVFVDFYTNGDYQGTYQLSEKVEVAKGRVEIPDLEEKTQDCNPEKALSAFPLFGDTKDVEDTVEGSKRGYEITKNPKDITGGYLLSLNIGYSYLDHKNAGFVSERNQAVDIDSPGYASREQVDYIADCYQDMEDAMYDWDGIHPQTGLHYYDYLDIDSFAKKYLIEEISKNLDASIASQYLYKYPDEISTKFFAGPVWDYDKSLGNGGKDGYNSCDLTDPEGFYASEDVTGHTIWYAIFFRPEFREAVVQNYTDNFRENILEIADMKLDTWACSLQESAYRNAIRWNRYGSSEYEVVFDRYQQEIQWLKDFIIKRIAFLDGEWT